jgi:hypothetical protein
VALAAAPAAAHADPVSTDAQRTYLAIAKRGISRAHDYWWNRHRGWYNERLGGRGNAPLATIWGVLPLFEARAALAEAEPTHANRVALRKFVTGAEGYFAPGFGGVGGYAPYPHWLRPSTVWFDDNGWWGLAFLDAYHANGGRRALRDAKRALRFIMHSGVDRRRGGIWWNTRHTYKAVESVASTALLAALLYRETGDSRNLLRARQIIAWADKHLMNDEGFYARSDRDETSMPYAQSPMAAAFQVLCEETDDSSLCDRAEDLAVRSVDRFGPELRMGPQYDAVYLRWLLYVFARTGNARLYEFAAANTARALAKAPDGRGLFLRDWDGSATGFDARPGMLRSHAATVSIAAWMAATTPP